MSELEFVGIDLFAGAGGVTTGIEQAQFMGNKFAKVVAAINHDPLAIASHQANHPETQHYIEDIRSFDLSKLPDIERLPNRRTFIWASLECTNFSNAKGGQSRDADSRTLAEHLYRYIEYVDPDYIYIENVREFMSWGPLIQKRHKLTGELLFDRKGAPIMIPDPVLKGSDYNKWVEHIKSYGYDFQYRMLNSANYGSHTKRIRYFGVFAKHGLPIAFPEVTHTKERWKPVKERLNLALEGESIFRRKKPLVPKTMNRLAYGIDKFVLNGQGSFIMSYYGTGQNVHSIDSPLGTITTHDRFALISADKGDVPEGFLLSYYGRDNAVSSLDSPCNAIPTQNKMALITIEKEQFITQHIQSRPSANSSLEEPVGALLTKDSRWLVTVDVEKKQFIEQRYSGEHNVASIEEPLGSITTVPKSSLITVLLESGIIKDIKMRMLTVQELKEIQGFGSDYVLMGPQKDQKKFVGNSVVPLQAQVLFEATYQANQEMMYQKLAA